MKRLYFNLLLGICCLSTIFGISPDDLQYLEKRVGELAEKHQVTGSAIAVLQKNEISMIKFYGFSDKEKGKKVDAHTVFQAGSISKSFSAWGILKLVEKDVIDLDRPIDDYLIRWHIPPSPYDLSEVTIRKVLNHTAGLSTPSYSGYLFSNTLPTLIDSLNGVKVFHPKLTLKYAPGIEFQYSGGGYTLLQLLVEERTGKLFQDYMREEILNPMGLFHSSFNLLEEQKKNLCKSYGAWNTQLPDKYFIEQAAAGFYTTIEDLASFASQTLQIYSGTSTCPYILEPKTLAHMMKADWHSYGLGYSVTILKNKSPLVFHLGANPGWRAAMFLLPTMGDGLVVLTNNDLGMDLISDIANDWLFLETGDYPEFYKEIRKNRQVVFALIVILESLLGVYLFLFLRSIQKRKRHLFILITFKTVIRILCWLALSGSWWIVFYTESVHPNKWVLAPFMPAGFNSLTELIFAISLIGVLSSFFRKRNRQIDGYCT